MEQIGVPYEKASEQMRAAIAAPSDMTSAPDSELDAATLTAAARGDRDASRMFVAVYQVRVFALASRFICSYGHLAESRWRDFGRMLDRVGRPETVVLSAMVGFDSFRHWLITNGANIELASSVQLTA